MIKKLIMVLILSIVVSCSCVDPDFINTVDNANKIMLNDLEKYIKNDKTIPEQSKKLRLESIVEYKELIQEYKGSKRKKSNPNKE